MTGNVDNSALPNNATIENVLMRIATSDPQIRAFVTHDPDLVRRRAAAVVETGPLYGMTVAVKDIIDTADYPTGCGSVIHAGHRSRSDAACVSLLEAAGGLTIGKTVTTEFAFFRPGPTGNPHRLGHTPGGSSSGSAAAVAAGMAQLGLGLQTAASLTRPASYCGVAGFKPSFGAYSLAGVKGLAPSFDTLGLLARDVATIASADAVLRAPVPRAAVTRACPPRRIGICRTPWWDKGDPGMHVAFDRAVALLSPHAALEEVDLSGFSDAAEVHSEIMSFEAAQSLAWEWHHHEASLSPQIIALLRRGRSVELSAYRAAQARATALRDAMARLLDRFELLLAPAAPGEAPSGLEATGDPIFSRLWTLLRLPTMTLPGLCGPTGLPIGVQVLGRLDEDESLLAQALWMERLLPPIRVPLLPE